MIAAAGRVASTLSALLLLSTAPALLAQGGRDPLARLQPNVRYRVELLIDSARLHGLPTGPLQSKALEGAAKRADGRAIVLEVTRVLRSLRDARAALGTRVTDDELAAAAGAIRVGITQTELATLARSREEKVLTVPLVVLTDLVTRGVPRDTASTTIFQLFQRGGRRRRFPGLVARGGTGHSFRDGSRAGVAESGARSPFPWTASGLYASFDGPAGIFGDPRPISA